MSDGLYGLLSIDDLAVFDRQARRTGNGESARVAEVIEFAPGESTPDVVWIHDPMADTLDDRDGAA